MRTNFYARFLLSPLPIFFLLMFTPCFSLFGQTADSLLFRDDFDRVELGSFWEAAPSWSIVNGSAYNFIDGIGGTLRTTMDYSQESYIIETSAKGFTDSYYREFRITFGQADLSNSELYEVRYTAYGGGRLTLSRSTDNIFFPQVLDEVAVFPALSSSEWYTFKVARYKSGLIQVYLDKGSGYDSIPVLEAIDLTYPTLGHTGWEVDTQTAPEEFYVDWFSASKPGVEKLAIKEKPAEDSLIIEVSAKSGRPYKVAKLIPEVKQFIDRDYTITSVPGYLNGTSFIQAANDDKLNTADSFLTFFVKTSAVVYIGYDPRNTAIPGWLTEWTKTADRITTNDKVGYLEVYSKLVEGSGELYPYPVILGGNLASPAVGAKTNYLVAAVNRPKLDRLQAEDALVSGAVVANNHLNYNGTGFVDFKNATGDYIEWSVQIDVPGTYNLGFTFANASLEDRSLQVTDNGVDAGTVTFIPISSSWDSWAFLNGPHLFLSPGIHKIRLTATGTSGPNIDELNIYYISASAPAPIALSRNSPLNQTSVKLPVQYHKAYPNPFSQSTKIYYDVKEKANVILSVYTLQGQQIQSLENGIREAGRYQATFNAAKFAKGIYFYRLQIGNDSKVGKLIKE